MSLGTPRVIPSPFGPFFNFGKCFSKWYTRKVGIADLEVGMADFLCPSWLD